MALEINLSVSIKDRIVWESGLKRQDIPRIPSPVKAITNKRDFGDVRHEGTNVSFQPLMGPSSQEDLAQLRDKQAQQYAGYLNSRGRKGRSINLRLVS